MNESHAHPEVEVIVLNWNSGAFLPDCLEALGRQDYPNFVVTLVDNGSTDDSVAWVRENFPDVALIENHVNLGFAAGNNVALRATAADIIALLNPDVVVAPDWLSRLVEALERDSHVGIVGSKLWYPDGRTIQHGGGFLRPPQAMPGHYAIGEHDTGQVDEPREVDYVIGGAVALRRGMVQEIGLLDEGYFLYFEDVDYCERARNAGWRVSYVPGATAVHVESANAVKDSFAYLQRFHTGRWRTILKHYPAESILDETIVAESEWSHKIPLKERLASALAYETTLSEWDEVLTARSRQGSGALDPETAAGLRRKLVWLRDTAMAGRPFLPGTDQSADQQTPEQSINSAIRNLSANVPTRDDSYAGILEVINRLRESTDGQQENIRYVSQMQMIRDALQAEEAQLAQSFRDSQKQLDDLEARVAVLVHGES